MFIVSRCSECGRRRIVDAELHEYNKMVHVPAYCSNCISEDPLRDLVVREFEPEALAAPKK